MDKILYTNNKNSIMNNKLLFKLARKSFPLLIIYAMIASFSFFGAQCSQIINGQNTSLTDFLFTWQLLRQSGTLIDICPGEKIRFGNDNFAGLSCPPYTDTLFREYYVDLTQNILTYKVTQVMYKFEFTDSAGFRNLNLYGMNVNRNLFYRQIPNKLKPDISSIRNGKSLNSSEILKK